MWFLARFHGRDPNLWTSDPGPSVEGSSSRAGGSIRVAPLATVRRTNSSQKSHAALPGQKQQRSEDSHVCQARRGSSSLRCLLTTRTTARHCQGSLGFSFAKRPITHAVRDSGPWILLQPSATCDFLLVNFRVTTITPTVSRLVQ